MPIHNYEDDPSCEREVETLWALHLTSLQAKGDVHVQLVWDLRITLSKMLLDFTFMGSISGKQVMRLCYLQSIHSVLQPKEFETAMGRAAKEYEKIK